MINKQKGTYDVLPVDNKKWLLLEQIVKEVFLQYNYEFIRTPIFEATNLFKRENESSDMVKKETYDFLDKGGREITLRPEGTAGVIRAVIENKLYVDKFKNKFFYFGPCFRYERPQKGRFREFYQFGCEVLAPLDAYGDCELILVAKRIMNKLNIDVEIKINSLGGAKSKQNYTSAIKDYFVKYKDNLCPDCLERIKTNPLRILDCKIDNSKDFFKDAPKAINYLDPNEKAYLNNIKSILDSINIENKIDYKIVRGLDYYSNLVFEIVSKKTNMVLAGGGRYDNLINDLGGPTMGAIGFAFGAERVIMEMAPRVEKAYTAAVIANAKNSLYATKVCELLRDNNISLYSDFLDRNFSKKLKDALSFNPKYLIFIQDDEQISKTVSLKKCRTQSQVAVKLDELVNKIKE